MNTEMAIERVINYRNGIGEAGNMRRALMHPRGSPVYIYCARAGYREIEMRLVAVRRPRPRSTFFSTAPRYFIQRHFSRRLILQSHCIKSKACIKQPFRPPRTQSSHVESRTSRNTAETCVTAVERDFLEESSKEISKCNFRPKALAH